jgi:hypothetical protein
MSVNRLIDLKRVESSPTEPVTLTEAKAKLIVTSTDDDTLITSLITSCRKAVENALHISLVAKTITMIADLCKEWELPYGPVTGLTYAGQRDGTQGSGPASYTTSSDWSTEGEEFISFTPGPIAGGFNPNVPFTGHFQWGPYASPYGQYPGYRWKIIYTAGYTSVPGDLKDAILMQIVHDYENRGEVDLVNVNRGLCIEAENLGAPYRRLLWF